MGLFSSLPSDLQGVRQAVSAAAVEISLCDRGAENPDALNDLMEAASEKMTGAREMLVAAGRHNDLKKLFKQLRSDGKFMNNGPFNRIYMPMLRENLGE